MISPQITKLIQDIQSLFRYKEHPGLKILTELYRKHHAAILAVPVRETNGYGFATGKRGTFYERSVRLVELLKSLKETAKSLYSVNTGDIASLVFLYDIGRTTLTREDLVKLESEPGLTTLGQSFLMAQDVALEAALGNDPDHLLTTLPVLYGILDGEPGVYAPEVTLAANLIRLDRSAIESLKFNVLNA